VSTCGRNECLILLIEALLKDIKNGIALRYPAKLGVKLKENT
jgi:hypothetical protein